MQVNSLKDSAEPLSKSWIWRGRDSVCEAEAESEKEELGMLYLENDNFIST